MRHAYCLVEMTWEDSKPLPSFIHKDSKLEQLITGDGDEGCFEWSEVMKFTDYESASFMSELLYARRILTGVAVVIENDEDTYIETRYVTLGKTLTEKFVNNLE